MILHITVRICTIFFFVNDLNNGKGVAIKSVGDAEMESTTLY